MAEFTNPEFLDNYDVDDVYDTMRGILPADIDSSEGSHTWNLLRPTALAVSELCEFVLPQVIQLIFPEWSYGEFLDAHAQTRGMARKAATPATGELTITGTPDTVIPAGSMFSTTSLNPEDPAMSYITTAQATIPGTGSVNVNIQCTEAGSEGNTGENTIILLSSSITGITAVTNPEEVSGGTDEESDEDLIARIEEYDQTQGDSFVGNMADYRRWATSVAGIGNASIIPPTDDSGIIQIVVTDTNGEPASEALCTNVYNYIMSPDDPYARLAPINAVIEVITPTTIDVAIKATVELTAEAALSDVSAALLTSLNAYLEEAMAAGEVKITRVAAIISATTGVNDFSGLQIGKKTGSTVSYGTDNIQLSATELPMITAEDLDLTEGTVG